MAKTVTINQDRLLMLKETMASDSNIASHDSYCSELMEAAPEVNEYEIGEESDTESDTPVFGGNYYHVSESASNFPQGLIEFLMKNKPDKFSNWVVFDLNNLSTYPRYFQKRQTAYDFYKWMKMDYNCKPKLLNLDKINKNINEGYSYNRLSNIDLSEVGLVEYEWYFDEDEYREWLQDCELTDSEEVRNQYYTEEVTYGVEYFDNVTYHYMDGDQNLLYDDLDDLFGKDMAKQMLQNCIENGGGKFETYELYEKNSYDLTNSNELNDIAMKLFRHGEYYKDCRGFILSNGIIVYTPNEHNEICMIPSVKTKFDFIRMGNIRVLPNSIDIGSEPTHEQEEVLRQVISSYANEELYLDIFNGSSEIGVKYVTPNWRYVIGEIDRYYSEGIKPQGNDFYESKENTETLDKTNLSSKLITESQESKSIAAAKKLVAQRLGYNEQEADDFVRIKLRNDIPSLRTPQGGKFILGVTRMFCDGELRNANDIGNLNSTLKLVASDAHISEYDRNLNGLSAQELIQRFAKAMSNNLEAEKAEINQMVFDTPSDYEIVRIDSFEQSSEYGDYVPWCVTHDEGMFDSYTNDGINQFYFCLKNGFENVVAEPSDGCPLDEYGLSMIAVSVNGDGMLNTCTCRWNHDNGGNDSIMNAKELSQVIGMNFFEVFKPNNKWKDLINSIMQRLANGENPIFIFEYVGNFCEGFAIVRFNDRFNFINQESRLLSGQWFDHVNNFCEGFAKVKLNDKFNFINQEGRVISDQWFDYAGDFNEGFAKVKLNDRFNFINQKGKFLSDKWYDDCCNFYNGFASVKIGSKWTFIRQDGKRINNEWYDYCEYFYNGFAEVEMGDKWYKIDTSGRRFNVESVDRNNKKLIINENQLISLKENIETEVESSEINLSSFKKNDSLTKRIWDGMDLNPRVRLKLLDIADDFWSFVNLKWVKPKNIILTGSICNFNWSNMSDIDLHLVVDFNEVDEKTEFVRDYFDSKKNEWNDEHNNLTIFGHKVELYVQDLDDETESDGIYDLEENNWIKEPNPNDVKPIELNKFSIKDNAAKIMTIIDDMYDAFSSTDDAYKIRQIGDEAAYLLKKVKEMRKTSLNKDGESGNGNIVYKILRRTGYLGRIWKLSNAVYDKTNSITESVKKYIKVLKEEFALDGNTERNPYKKRWDAERKALKDFICNNGVLMQSKEDNKQGKIYKCFTDTWLSNLIGYNYCLCVQWDEIKMKPKSVVYIRALDKFTPNIKRNIQFDNRGFDNVRGTYDDTRYYNRMESKHNRTVMINESSLALLTESKNSKRAHNQTRQIIAKEWEMDVNDPRVIQAEQTFEKLHFGVENKRVDWFIILEPVAYMWFLTALNNTVLDNYLSYIYTKATSFERPSEYIAQIRQMTDFNQMKQYIDNQMAEDKAARKEQMNNMEANLNTNYEVLGPLSFEEAQKYGNKSGAGAGNYGRICYTQYSGTWSRPDYSNNDQNQCYLLLRNDWEEVDAVHDGSEKNNGLKELQYNGYDDYGLSMIFVWINPSGELHECNTRWNHEAQYAPGRSVDQALNEVDIAKLMGAPFGKVFGVKSFDENIKEAEEKLANGEKPYDVFDLIGETVGNGTIIVFKGKYNIIDNSGTKIILPNWVERIQPEGNDYFSLYYTDGNGYGRRNLLRGSDLTLVWDKPFDEWPSIMRVENGGVIRIDVIWENNYKTNFIRPDGTLLWYKPIEWWFESNQDSHFFDGEVAKVALHGYYNYLKKDGTLLWDKPLDDWFTEAQIFRENGMAIVGIVERENYGTLYNIIRKDGTLVSQDGWFNGIGNFSDEGTAYVYVKFENHIYYNFIRLDGSIVWDKPLEDWFIGVSNFKYGLGIVENKLEGDENIKENLLKPDGTLVLNAPVEKWFDDVRQIRTSFFEGFYVKLNNKYNLVNPDGTYLWNKPFDEWFVDIDSDELCVMVAPRNGAWYFITPDGELFTSRVKMIRHLSKINANGDNQ